MNTAQPCITAKTRSGGWLPKDPRNVAQWIRKLKQRVAENPTPWVPPIQELYDMVYSDPVLYGNVAAMFADAYFREKFTPLGWQPEVKDFAEFLDLLNAIMTTAPECYFTIAAQGDHQPELQPAGLIGFPINALLDWPMATTAGYDVFSNALINQQFKKILNYWSQFLVTPDSRYVLTDPDFKEETIGWLSKPAQAWIVDTANQAVGDGTIPHLESFADVFQCNPQDLPYYGFGSWDQFFVREFVEGVRPVSSPDDDSVIVNACESAPFAYATNVPASAQFWLKDQAYSLENMLNWDEYTPQFIGGTVYQAFLSALSYHRWHSPVSGTIVKAYVVNGSYYLENLYQSFLANNPDTSAPNNSQGFLTAVATRALIFIQADNPAIGLMCVMPVGMAEVSSCEITVQPGQHVNKGEQLGMFHFGGSTHCLFFRPGVQLDFNNFYGLTPGPAGDTNIRVNTALATCQS